MASPIQVGERVHVTVQHVGTVRFLGRTEFAPEDWVGVELDDPHGKNDGCVKRNRYFTCPSQHGLFVRPKSVTSLRGGHPGRPSEITDYSPKISQSSPAPCLEVQRTLAEAVENHDVTSLCHHIPLAIKARIAPRELESAWRTLDFEVERLCESESRLQKENGSLMRELEMLIDMSRSSCSTAATLSDQFLEVSGVAGMNEGDCERVNATQKELLAELSTAKALASELRTELSAAAVQQQTSNFPFHSGVPEPHEAWLNTISRTIRDSTMPLREHIENKTNEVILNWQSRMDIPEQSVQGSDDVKGDQLHQPSSFGNLVQEVLDSVMTWDAHPDNNTKLTLGPVMS